MINAEYPNKPGFLAPYRNVHYHLQDFCRGGQRPRQGNEIFNYVHCSLRNIIKRCFSVLKARFPILKVVASYKFNTQMLIVVVRCTLHNFVRQEAHIDWLFQEYNIDCFVVFDHASINDDDDPNEDVPSQLQ